MYTSYFLNDASYRYYKLIMQKDLLGHHVITCIWGSLVSKLGNYKNYAFATIDEAKDFILQVQRKRLKRGYIEIGI